MGSRREKILQKLNPKLLKMTPKLSGDVGSFIDLDSDNSLESINSILPEGRSLDNTQQSPSHSILGSSLRDPVGSQLYGVQHLMSSSLEDGAKNLMIRFLRNQDLIEKNKRNSSENVTEVTVSSAKYSENNEICEIISERLTLPLVKNDGDDGSERPGKRLQKLKMELQEKMSAKWEEEYKKRVSDNKVYSQFMHKHKKKGSDEENSDNGKELEDEENKDVDGKENSSDDEFGDDEEGFESDGASNAGEEPEDDCEKSEENKPERDDDSDSADGCSLVPAYQPGGGMLYGGSELTQSEEGLPQNLLSPSLRLSITESPASASKLSTEFQNTNDTTPKKAVPVEEVVSFTQMNKLFSQNPSDSFDLNEAFEFCSGKFPDTQSCFAPLLKTGTQENFQDENSNEGNSSIGEEQEDEEEGNEEKSQASDDENEQEISKTRKNIIAFEDSDDEEEIRNDGPVDEPDEPQSAVPELLSDDEEAEVDDKLKKRKKPKKTLHFSDEEDSVNDCLDMKDEENSNSAANDEDELESEDEQRSVHYDSEENEIINPKEFFEKEAELSGSEWSGDEDERGLDEFDVEEGDADKIDDDQVRSQLEKIHIRRVLDDDAREVRLIQEILFEDGDLHSDGKRRDRKFKWKNLGTFDENLNEGEPKEEGDCSSEDDGAMEEELRKIRHEKELFLMTKKKNGDVSSDEEIIEDFHTVKVTSVKASIKSGNVEYLENSKTIVDYTKNVCNARGSFLTRNEQFLSKLAKATSGVTDNVLGPKSSKNFVFATKSPEKKNEDKTTVSKRQIEDPGSCRRDKKIKLLLPEMDKEPSILDLLV